MRGWIFHYALKRHSKRPVLHPRWRGHYGYVKVRYTFQRNIFKCVFFD